MSDETTEISIIYKPAIALQGDLYTPVPINAHTAELNHFGVGKIYGSCTTNWLDHKRADGRPIKANVFAISSSDWMNLQKKIDGAFGFRVWLGSPHPELGLPDGLVHGHAPRLPLEDIPVLIRELIGKECRAYQTGDSLDLSRNPNRVSIETDADGMIVGVWMG